METSQSSLNSQDDSCEVSPYPKEKLERIRNRRANSAGSSQVFESLTINDETTSNEKGSDFSSEQQQRGPLLGLKDDEVAFYDAILTNDSAVLMLGDETLKKIARELVVAVRESATIDWSLKESVRASMRSKVRRLLAKYDYPPDAEDAAVELVLEQAEHLASVE